MKGAHQVGIERLVALAEHEREARKVHSAPLRDRITLLECWCDQQSWKAWRKIAKPPTVKPRESFAKLYRSDKAEKPF